MNKKQAKAKLREICANISNNHAIIQAGFSNLILRNWLDKKENSVIAGEIFNIIRQQLEILLNETYDGKIFKHSVANRALSGILICNDLIEALEEEDKGRKPCAPSLH